jgi:hypothetical protein
MQKKTTSHVAWAVAATVVGVVAIVTTAALVVFFSLRSLPGEIADSGRAAAGEVRRIAAAFREGRVETTFVNYASRATGSTFLQLATLRQVEVYTRKETGTVLWGRIELPDVVVSATVPVEYTYFVDLDEEWVFRLEGARLEVRAPAINFNTPSLDVSALHFEVLESSPLRDETEVAEALRAGLTRLSRNRAADHVDLVRETARREVAEFVSTWMAGAFSDADRYTVEVLFADEARDPIRVDELVD